MLTFQTDWMPHHLHLKPNCMLGSRHLADAMSLENGTATEISKDNVTLQQSSASSQMIYSQKGTSG